jgi:malate synthase
VHHGRVARADVERIIAEVSAELPDESVYREARSLFERLALGERFEEFLTLPAYEQLLEDEASA